MSDMKLSLSESEDAPFIVADVVGHWNGFPVPRITGAELSAHYTALRNNDPNGTWGDVVVSILPTTWIKMWDKVEDPDGDDAYVWFVDGADTRAPIDGLCWNVVE